MSQNPFTAKVFDPETMLFDLAEARKTETKFRENILSLMMSVLISSTSPTHCSAVLQAVEKPR